jgi:hypothetical protein
MRSPAPPVFNQEGEAVSSLRRLGRELEVAEVPPRLANLERLWGIRDDPRNGCVSIEHGKRATIAHGPQMFAEARFQVRDFDVAHDQLWSRGVTDGQVPVRWLEWDSCG